MHIIKGSGRSRCELVTLLETGRLKLALKFDVLHSTASPLTVAVRLLPSSVWVSRLVWNTLLAVSGDDGVKARLQAGTLIHALSTSLGHGLLQHQGADPRESQPCPPRALGLTGVGGEKEAGQNRATEELSATGTHSGEGLLASSGHHWRSLPRRRDTELPLKHRHFSGGMVPRGAPRPWASLSKSSPCPQKQ